jgi:SAM-dependent methyltransferase
MKDFEYPEPDPNKKTPAEIWNARYSQTGYLFGKEPVSGLKSLCTHLRKGKVLDVGMGEGRNSVFLAGQGFQVEGIDGSSVGVEKAKSLAAEKGVTIEAKTQNLDFFLMPLMRYDSILMTYFRPQARFFSEIRRGLVLGGTFFLEAYTTEHVRHLKAPNPNIDFEECYKTGEVLSHLKDFSVLYYNEIPEGGFYTVRVLAQKSKV